MSWCFVSREFPPFSGGGIGTYALAMAQSLVMAGEKPIVITVGDGVQSESVEDSIVVIRLPLVKGDDWSAPHPAVRTPKTVAAWNALGPHAVFSMLVADILEDVIARHSVDLVEFADTGAAGWFTLNRRRNLGGFGDVRMLTKVHSPSAWIEENNRRCEPGRQMHDLQRMEREQALWSDAVITPSQYMADLVLGQWGVTAGVMRNPLPVFENIPEDPEDIDVLFVGRLEYRKGIDTLCHAWKLLNLNSHRLHLVGQDVTDERTGIPIGERLISEMPRDVALRVIEHGSKSPSSVKAMQNVAKVVVVPSPVDTVPYTCAEAMASGRVVVASDIGGAVELVDDGINGFLFESGNSESLAISIRRALDLPEAARIEMGELARKRIALLCSAAAVVSARREHAKGVEHWRDILSDPECTAINAGLADDQALKLLCTAVTNSGAAFAIGWPKVGKRMIVHGSPSFAGLLAGPREVGAIVVRRSWLERPEIAPLVPEPENRRIGVRDAWKLLASILSCGGEGVVVPEAVIPASEPSGLAIKADVHALIDTAIVRGKPGQPVGRGVRLAPAFEEQTGTVKSRVMGTAKKLLGG